MCIACSVVFVVCLVVFCVYGLCYGVLHAWVMVAVILYDWCESCIWFVYVWCVACVDGCALGCVCCMYCKCFAIYWLMVGVCVGCV